MHSDIWEPSSVTSSYLHRFYIHSINDLSKFSWLVHNSNNYNAFLNFKLQVESLFDRMIKKPANWWRHRIFTFWVLLEANGIAHRVSYPYTPKQNGTAEWKHCPVVETGLTLKVHASIPSQHWHEVFQTAIFLINMLPSESFTGPTRIDVSIIN